MPGYYVDSSVLVKRHVNEIGSAWVQTTLSMVETTVTTAHISVTEVYSAFNRRVREGSLDEAIYMAIITDFDSLCTNEYDLVALTAAIVTQSRLLLERYPLRAYDAIQLASALVANAILRAVALPNLIFVSADDRLLIAAQAEGFATDNPHAHP